MVLSRHVLNQRLLQTVGFGWLAFLLVGIAIARLFDIAQVTVLVDRSACNALGWQQLGDRYTDLYQAHERGRIQLLQLVIVSDLGEEVRETIPTPEDFRAIAPYGSPDAERLERIKNGFSELEVLAC